MIRPLRRGIPACRRAALRRLAGLRILRLRPPGRRMGPGPQNRDLGQLGAVPLHRRCGAVARTSDSSSRQVGGTHGGSE